ncbi:hypothetical protein JXJ21_10185 [candidate division KSB1 bacterium]|nr:hypothetical protein [candidate division KSB1 bacterium]
MTLNRCASWITGMLMVSLLIASSVSHSAESISNIPGAFADIGLGAVRSGMGGSLIVLGRDVYAIMDNPAGTVSILSPQLAFSTTKPYALIPYNVLLYGQKLGKKNSLGTGFITSGDEALRENSIILNYARILPFYSMSVGVNLKFRHASFSNNSDGKWIFNNADRQVTGNATGVGLDIGVRGKLGKRMAYAVVLKDLFESISYNASNAAQTAKGGSESVPSTMVLGIGYVAAKNLAFELDLNKALYREVNDRVTFGAEQWLFSMVALRAGLSQNINADEINRQYALGCGVATEFSRMHVGIALDFAYLINEFHDFYHAGLKLSWGSN